MKNHDQEFLSDVGKRADLHAGNKLGRVFLQRTSQQNITSSFPPKTYNPSEGAGTMLETFWMRKRNSDCRPPRFNAPPRFDCFILLFPSLLFERRNNYNFTLGLLITARDSYIWEALRFGTHQNTTSSSTRHCYALWGRHSTMADEEVQLRPIKPNHVSLPPVQRAATSHSS